MPVSPFLFSPVPMLRVSLDFTFLIDFFNVLLQTRKTGEETILTQL